MSKAKHLWLYLAAATAFIVAAGIFMFVEDNVPLGAPFAVLAALNFGLFFQFRKKSRDDTE